MQSKQAASPDPCVCLEGPLLRDGTSMQNGVAVQMLGQPCQGCLIRMLCSVVQVVQLLTEDGLDRITVYRDVCVHVWCDRPTPRAVSMVCCALLVGARAQAHSFDVLKAKSGHDIMVPTAAPGR
jgi:hypothetical protein